jgi:hypothetical protein
MKPALGRWGDRDQRTGREPAAGSGGVYEECARPISSATLGGKTHFGLAG